MTALRKLTLLESKLYFREGPAALFGLAFPTVLLIIFGSLPSMRVAQPDLGGLRTIDIYLPILVGLGLATLALSAFPASLAVRRERGMLRRLSTTPMGAGSLLTAQLLVTVAAAVCSVAVLIVLGRTAFGVALPRQFAGFLLVLVLLAVALFSLGLLIAALAPTARSAAGIGSLLYLPMMATAGLWSPGATPQLLVRIGGYTPLGAGVRAVQDTWAGGWPHPAQLLVLLAWAVVCGGVSARVFRWE